MDMHYLTIKTESYIKIMIMIGRLRGSSMGVCEALCAIIACKKGYTNKFDLIWLWAVCSSDFEKKASLQK